MVSRRSDLLPASGASGVYHCLLAGVFSWGDCDGVLLPALPWLVMNARDWDWGAAVIFLGLLGWLLGFLMGQRAERCPDAQAVLTGTTIILPDGDMTCGPTP